MLRNWKIWQRFALVAVAFTIPMAVLLYQALQSQSYQSNFANQELAGTSFEKPFQQLHSSLLQHRDLTIAVKQGLTNLSSAQEKATLDVDEDLKKLEAANATLGATLGTSDEVANVKQIWQRLKVEVDATSATQAMERYGRLLRALYHLNVTFGNSSNLILDPDVDSYYAMDATTFKIYKLMDELSQMRALGTGMTAGLVVEPGDSGRGLMASLASRADDSLNQLSTNLEFGLDANQRFSSAARPVLDDVTTAVRRFLDSAAAEATTGSAFSDGEASWAAATKPLAALEKLHATCLAELERMLRDRLARLAAERTKGLGIALLGIAVASLLLFVAIRSITRPVRELTTVAERISLGEMDARLAVSDKSEIGALADSFRRMQTSLATAMEALRVRS